MEIKRRPWRTTILLCIVGIVVLSGCGTPQTDATQQVTPVAPPVQDIVFVRTADDLAVHQITVFADQYPATTTQLPWGTFDHTWSTLYAARYDPTKQETSVQAIDPVSGQVLRSTTLPGNYHLPTVGLDGTLGGLSPLSRWLVLADALAQDDAAQQRFMVLSPAFDRPPQLVELPGQFTFDAMSDDGSSLYLMEYAATDQAKYQVRRYDLPSKTLDPNIIVGKGNAAVMRGVRHVSLPSRDGQWLFSLYLNATQGPFIHALNLTNRFAMCIFLPHAAAADQRLQRFWSLAMAPNGNQLYAVNGALGSIAVLDANTPQILRSGKLGDTKAHTGNPTTNHPAHGGSGQSFLVGSEQIPTGFAAIGRDGATLYALGAHGLQTIRTKDLALASNHLADQALASLTLSADGHHLYAISAEQGRVLQIDLQADMRATQVDGVRGARGVLWAVQPQGIAVGSTQK